MTKQVGESRPASLQNSLSCARAVAKSSAGLALFITGKIMPPPAWAFRKNATTRSSLYFSPVITGEKYKDERGVAFFRNAHAGGGMIFPVMNKANPADDFATARAQLKEFCRDAGLDSPTCFVIVHDFTLANDFQRPVP